MSIPLKGFPAASITSDVTTRDVPSTLDTWLGEDTPFGRVFGSSETQQYMNLSTGDDGDTSITTFTFDSPTPSGWGFAVGDVDAGEVAISALGVDGAPLTPNELGFQDAFNYCESSNPPPCANKGAKPTWHPDGRLTGSGSNGGIVVRVSEGESGWFQPTAPITQLEFRYEAPSSFSVYKLWFAALSRDISGHASLDYDRPPPPGSSVELLELDGAVIDTTTPDADGNYQFTGLPSAAYAVRVVPPEGYSVVDEDTQDADTTDGDVSGVDFILTTDPTTPSTTTPSSTTTTPTTIPTVPPGPDHGPGPGPNPPPPPDGGGGGVGGARGGSPAPSSPGSRLPETGTATLIGGLLGLFGVGLGVLLIGLSRREEQGSYQPRHMALAYSYA